MLVSDAMLWTLFITSLSFAASTPIENSTVAGDHLNCALSYLAGEKIIPVPGGGADATLTDQKIQLSEANRDVELSVTIDPTLEKNSNRGFRIVLRNKRSDIIGHIDGRLALLRGKGGATLRLQAPEGVNTLPKIREIQVNCQIQ